MQSCGVFDLDIWPGGGDVFSDLFIFLSMFFLHGFICMDLLTWIYSHGFIHMHFCRMNKFLFAKPQLE